MRVGLNAKTTHSAFLPQNFVTSNEKRILRIPGSASFLSSYPTEPVPTSTIAENTQILSLLVFLKRAIGENYCDRNQKF